MSKHLILALCIAIFVIYFRSLFNGFVWDDEEQVLANSIIKHLSNIPYLFTASTFNSGGGGSLAGWYYKPLMSVSFALNYAIFGTNAFGFHLFSVCLHMADTVLVFLLFKKLLTWQKLSYPKTVSFVIALIFALHPANVESVAYISSTQELLYMFFLLLSMFISFSYFSSSEISIKTLLFINLFILLSLLSKESGIIAIPVILALGFLINKRKDIYLFVTSLVTFLFYLFLRFFIAKTPLSARHSIVPISQAGLAARLTTVPYELFSYLRLLFFPKDLFVAQHNVIRSISDPRFYISLIIALLFFSFIIAMYFKLKSKLYLFLLFWFSISLVLILNIYPLDMTIAERWLYGPMVPFLGIFSVIAYSLKAKQKAITAIFLIVVIFIFSIRSIERTLDWQSDLTLFSADIRYVPDSFDAQNNLGVALFRQNDLENARIHFKASIKLSPKWWTNYSNLGVIYERQKNYKEAEKLFKQSIKNGGYYLAYENLARLLYQTKPPKKTLKFIMFSLKVLPYNETLNKIAALCFYDLNATSSALLYAKRTYLINPTYANYDLYQKISNQ